VAGGTAPGEVVVLTRATTDMRAYERAFERRGLPTYVIGGRGYWSHPQVVDMVAYLRALANPRDEESLYTVLASPLVGASFDALVVLAAAARAGDRDPWWLLREPAGELDALGESDRSRLSAFAGWFRGEREHSARAGIESLIDRALARTGYDLGMLAMPGGQRRLANVRKLMRLGREHEDGHGPDLRGFLTLVADREAGRAADSRESEAPVEGDGLDAVRLMTIHRAKGLEFDTVCVADLGRSPWRPNEILRVAPDGRVGLRLVRAGVAGRASAFAYDELGEERQRAAEAEERRLFYVAMTRARERLVLSGATRFEAWTGDSRFNGGGPIAWIAPALVPELGEALSDGGGVLQRDGYRVRLTVSRPQDPDRGPGSPASEPSAPMLAAPPGAPRPALGSPVPPAPTPLRLAPPIPEPLGPPVATLSYSALQEYARCGYRFYAERVLGLPAAPRSGHSTARAPQTRPAIADASERGVLVHALLERLDFRRPVVPGQKVVAAAAARAGIAPPAPAEAEELLTLVAGFAAGELCARRLTRVARSGLASRSPAACSSPARSTCSRARPAGGC
jgi:ATP-dependent exoDNAse (exonuclease V) beta subunit